MAEAPRNLELLLSCQVCFEDFEEEGKHVPRLLPCTHTLCHTCIGQLIQGNKIECPECREKHEAKKEEKTFPQNKYILTQIKRKPLQKQPGTHEFQKCEEHDKELSLYCTEPDCEKPICRFCLRKHHKSHVIVAIEDQEKEELTEGLMRIDKNLGTKVEMLSQAKKNIGDRTKSVIEEIKKRKEEFDRHCQEIIKEVEGLNKLQNLLIDDEISAMNSNLDLLRSLRQNIENDEEVSHEEIMNSHETVRRIIENIDTNLSGERSFGYPVVSLDRCSVEEFLEVTKDEITVSMLHLQEQIEEQLLPETISNAFKCTVTETFNTGIDSINSFTLLNKSTAIICGAEDGSQKVKSYDLQTGSELNCLNLKHARGVAGVKLGGKVVLVVACRDEQRIDFRDVNDFNKILHSHSVAPHRPTKLETIAESILMYVDVSRKPFTVHWLDVNESKPKPAAQINATHTKQTNIEDICFIENGGKKLLIVAAGKAGLFAYNTETDQLEWKVDQKVSGMKQTIDARGVIAVEHDLVIICDFVKGNKCIQMFSASDGQYLGRLVKGVETIGNPGRIYWNAETSSLVAACSLQGKWQFNIIIVQYHETCTVI